MAINNFLPGSPNARKMVALAFLSQNCVTGMVLGAYGALIPSIEIKFGTTRAFSSLGIALVVLTLGLLSPLVGLLLRRVSIKATLVSGATINAIGYLLLSMVGDITTFLAIFGTLIGTGTVLMANIAPATLISHWYHEGRGKALGLVNMPVFLMLIPPIAATIVTSVGLVAWFLCAAAAFALLVPLMLLVIDEPELVGERAFGAAAEPAAVTGIAADTPPLIKVRTLIASPQFWLLTLGVGFSTGAGNAFITHVIPFAEAKAFSIQSSSLLLTTYGAAGLVGNLALGWLSDRIGASRALSISAVGQALLWAALLIVGGFPMLIAIAALLGLFTTSVVALHGASVNELFGHRNVSSVMGFGYLVKLPFMFGAVFLTGYLFDLTGSYSLPFAALGAGMLAVALGFFFLSALTPRSITPVAPARP